MFKLYAIVTLCTITSFLNPVCCQVLNDFERVLLYDFSEVDISELNALNAEIDYLKKDNGLRFNSSLTKNDFAGLEFGSIWRLNAGLQFDLFRDGLGERKKKVQLLELDQKINNVNLELTQQDRNYAYAYNYIIYLFNKEKRQILEQKKFLLASLINKNYDLYYNHELSYNDILYLNGLNDECDLLLLSMSQVDQLFEKLVTVDELPSFKATELPILQFLTDSLLTNKTNTSYEKIKELRKEQLVQKAALDDQPRLSLYVNIHARPRVEAFDLNPGLYNSFGIRYQTAFYSRSKEQKKLIELQEQVIDHKFDDLAFNQHKELINLILDYNTKLRQYSNFVFKLEKLYEQKRVEQAVQNVSTISTPTKQNWTFELEILNVTYELIELKQLLYLSLLRIYNKAELKSITPFVSELEFKESKKRFLGNRVLKITMKQLLQLDKDFIVHYLQKNNFDFVLCIDAENCEVLKNELYKKGIKFYDDPALLSNHGIVIVPTTQFTSRSELEIWINDQLNVHPDHFLLFDEIEDLVELDHKTLSGE